MLELPSKLRQKPFSAREAKVCGLSKAGLTRMVKAGVLERLSRGVYQVGGMDDPTGEDRYRMATIRAGEPSAICLLSALEHYHVTGEISRKVWVLAPAEKRVVSKDVQLIRARQPRWKIGIRKARGYSITSLERTLIDGLIHKRKIGIQVALEAIKQALAQKKVKLGSLIDMAKKLKAEDRLHPYLEALAV